MRLWLRGVRVIDPAADLNSENRDVWIEDGRLLAIDHGPPDDGAEPIDLTPRDGQPACVLCPGFIDVHAHLREPGDAAAETVLSGAVAAAAGGFTTVLAMANTHPPIDTPRHVAEAVRRNSDAPISVLQVAALTQGLGGHRLTDIEACIEAGALAIGDDGRNAASAALLQEGLRIAARHERAVLVHPEDEEAIARRAGRGVHLPVAAVRPPEVEIRAVDTALGALRSAGSGRLHLQHISTAGAVDLLRHARESGLVVTAEVTPHHLTMQQSAMDAEDALRKVNPPIRGAEDVEAVRNALASGLIDAVATDHAPHRAHDKEPPYDRAAAGMIGFETALAQCLSIAELAGIGLPRLVAALTTGPHHVLGVHAPVEAPRLRVGEPATVTLFDPAAEWTVTETSLRSHSHNTPLLGSTVRGRVLMTVASGRVVHMDDARLTRPIPVVHD